MEGWGKKLKYRKLFFKAKIRDQVKTEERNVKRVVAKTENKLKNILHFNFNVFHFEAGLIISFWPTSYTFCVTFQTVVTLGKEGGRLPPGILFNPQFGFRSFIQQIK